MELENLVWDLAKLTGEYINMVRALKLDISPEMMKELRENVKFVIDYADGAFQEVAGR